MNEESIRQSVVPRWFWVLGALAVVWNLLGLTAFIGEMLMTDEALASFPEAQQELYRNKPLWVNVCFAIAVIGGVLGSVLLLMRSRLAIPVLALSLLGVLGQYGYMFFMTNTPAVMGAAMMVLPALVVLISVALVPYAMSCRSRGLLR